MIAALMKTVSLLFFSVLLLISSYLVLPLSAWAAVYSDRLELVHKNTKTGLSSVFSYVNTGTSTANYAMEFYWPNDEYVATDFPPALPAGGGCVDPCNNTCPHSYEMESSPLGLENFVGYVIISSDQPFEACINTPDYGIINGTVYESNASTAVASPQISAYDQSSDTLLGSVPGLTDGHFYIGGLPSEKYVVLASGNENWISQWYGDAELRCLADTVRVDGVSQTSISFNLHERPVLGPGNPYDLSICKIDSADPVYFGNTLTYTLYVTNLGPYDPTTGVSVIDTLPPDTDLISISPASSVWNCTEISGVITCTSDYVQWLSPFAPPVKISVTVPSKEVNIINVAEVNSANDYNPSNNVAIEETSILFPWILFYPAFTEK